MKLIISVESRGPSQMLTDKIIHLTIPKIIIKRIVRGVKFRS